MTKITQNFATFVIFALCLIGFCQVEIIGIIILGFWCFLIYKHENIHTKKGMYIDKYI